MLVCCLYTATIMIVSEIHPDYLVCEPVIRYFVFSFGTTSINFLNCSKHMLPNWSGNLFFGFHCLSIGSLQRSGILLD